MNPNNDQKITFTVADVNNDYGDMLRTILPRHAMMFSADPANLAEGLREWFMFVDRDYNCAYTEDEGPLAYYTIHELTRPELKTLAVNFRDDTLGTFVPEMTDEDVDKNYALLFLIFQFAFLVMDESYLVPLLDIVVLSEESREEVRVNIKRIKNHK